MNAREAVAVAKAHVTGLFADEEIDDIGLEEVDYDDARDQWLITIGFSRVWNRPDPIGVLVVREPRRTYKVVAIDADGTPRSVKNRDTANAD